MAEPLAGLVADARRVLGIERLAFAIHDASFPGDPATDLGHGSPYGHSAWALLRSLRDVGFDVLQLGPQGETSEGNPSPYDGAAFSRRTASADVSLLAGEDWGHLLSGEALESRVRERPRDAGGRVAFAFARRAQRELLDRARRALCEGSTRRHQELRQELARFGERHTWLERDALFEQLERQRPGPWIGWGDPDSRLLHPTPGGHEAFARRRAEVERQHRDEIDTYAFAQFVVHQQHHRFRHALSGIGMRVHGDVQIGLSPRDSWAFQPWFLPGYRMGAPPSRTNPQGQDWGYPVFDPRHYHASDGRGPGPVLRFLGERMAKLFEEYDGLRIDHPHGLVCPWVYRSDDPDPVHSVQNGARLFSAHDLPDHPELRRFAIPRRDQLSRDPARARWDERWVEDIDPDQESRYAILFDAVVAAACNAGCSTQDLACEVLSTMPLPLGRVVARHGLGRFRVTQKLDPADPDDPYRLEHASPADWVMIGTHDTPPLWQLLEEWTPERLEARARYSAWLLEPDPAARETFARLLLRDRGLLAQAMLAELLASRAGNVMVFFSDWFGLETPYNRPGTVSHENWSLRLEPDWAARARDRLREHRALNLPLALALALRARALRPELQAALLAEAARSAGPAPLPELWGQAWNAAGG